MRLLPKIAHHMAERKGKASGDPPLISMTYVRGPVTACHVDPQQRQYFASSSPATIATTSVSGRDALTQCTFRPRINNLDPRAKALAPLSQRALSVAEERENHLAALREQAAMDRQRHETFTPQINATSRAMRTTMPAAPLHERAVGGLESRTMAAEDRSAPAVPLINSVSETLCAKGQARLNAERNAQIARRVRDLWQRHASAGSRMTAVELRDVLVELGIIAAATEVPHPSERRRTAAAEGPSQRRSTSVDPSTTSKAALSADSPQTAVVAKFIAAMLPSGGGPVAGHHAPLPVSLEAAEVTYDSFVRVVSTVLKRATVTPVAAEPSAGAGNAGASARKDKADRAAEPPLQLTTVTVPVRRDAREPTPAPPVVLAAGGHIPQRRAASAAANHQPPLGKSDAPFTGVTPPPLLLAAEKTTTTDKRVRAAAGRGGGRQALIDVTNQSTTEQRHRKGPGAPNSLRGAEAPPAAATMMAVPVATGGPRRSGERLGTHSSVMVARGAQKASPPEPQQQRDAPTSADAEEAARLRLRLQPPGFDDAVQRLATARDRAKQAARLLQQCKWERHQPLVESPNLPSTAVEDGDKATTPPALAPGVVEALSRMAKGREHRPVKFEESLRGAAPRRSVSQRSGSAPSPRASTGETSSRPPPSNLRRSASEVATPQDRWAIATAPRRATSQPQAVRGARREGPAAVVHHIAPLETLAVVRADDDADDGAAIVEDDDDITAVVFSPSPNGRDSAAATRDGGSAPLTSPSALPRHHRRRLSQKGGAAGRTLTHPHPFELQSDQRAKQRGAPPFLYVDVDMPNGKRGRIGVHHHDSLAHLARQFAVTYQLDDDMEGELRDLLDRSVANHRAQQHVWV